jgi:hypothetical protein
MISAESSNSGQIKKNLFLGTIMPNFIKLLLANGAGFLQ